MQGVWRFLVFLLAASAAGAAANPTGATFPGRNGRIAFASLRDGDYELYSMRADASELTRLTTNSAADIHPAWSPDGRRIVFASNRSGDADVYVAESDGSGVVRLTTATGADFDPDWSPDGTRIVFTSRRDGDEEIYVMNADGGAPTRLTTAGGTDANPAWSPDGRTILFASARTGTSAIYAMGVDGSNQRRLTFGAGSDVSPSWSPDGTRIAFSSNRDGNYEIYVMNADGSGQTRLTRNLSADIDPAWSPAGDQIAFTTTRDVNYEIYLMSATGTGETRLTTNEAEDTTPSWQSIPIPPVVVSNAAFRARWRESRVFGTLELQGNVATPVIINVALKRGPRVWLSARLDLPAGAFRQALKLPPGLLPGRYLLEVTPAAGSNFSAQQLELDLPAPPEGVVTEAYTSTNPGGVPVRRFPPRTPTVFAQFRFAVLPRPRLQLTVTWYKPTGGRAGPPVRKPRSAVVVSYVSGLKGGPLPRGRWRAVLRAGRTVVKQLAFKVA